MEIYRVSVKMRRILFNPIYSSIPKVQFKSNTYQVIFSNGARLLKIIDDYDVTYLSRSTMNLDSAKYNELLHDRIDCKQREYDDVDNDYDGDWDSRTYGYENDEDDNADFTACSLDDCGYCGQCLY